MEVRGSRREINSMGEWSATRKLSCNRVREVIEANRRGTWMINAVTGKVPQGDIRAGETLARAWVTLYVPAPCNGALASRLGRSAISWNAMRKR